ncbi:MAG: SRPBCC family protein [Opitutales bacterium]|jgi:ligand-binding SRPBCC domain-containing protein
MPALKQLYREQVIATDLNTAWDFIRRPQNLNRITPDDMSFEIISEVPEEMYNGLMIEYRIGIPLLGKQPWLSEIKHVRDHHSFVDEQRIGPYRLWYHYHEISEHADGVRFVDRVHYTLPFGPLGAIAHWLYVKKQLQYIFDYRRQAMVEVFS